MIGELREVSISCCDEIYFTIGKHYAHGKITAVRQIKANSKYKIFKNEIRRFIFTRPGLYQPSGPKDGSELPVSTMSFQLKEVKVVFSRNSELNVVCKEVCVEKTFTCITNCNPTDSDCLTTCLNAETICVDRKY